MEVKVEIGVEVKVVVEVEVHPGEEKEKKRRQKKPSVPKPGNPEKNMEYKRQVIQLRGSRPQGPLVVTDGGGGGWVPKRFSDFAEILFRRSSGDMNVRKC